MYFIKISNECGMGIKLLGVFFASIAVIIFITCNLYFAQFRTHECIMIFHRVLKFSMNDIHNSRIYKRIAIKMHKYAF